MLFMEIFKTLIREDCKLGRLEHTEGFISGIQFALCSGYDGNIYTTHLVDGKGIVLTVKCLKEQYDQFVDVVKQRYPEVCIFNYKERSSR